jgi:hypothetical protein
MHAMDDLKVLDVLQAKSLKSQSTLSLPITALLTNLTIVGN